jgi:hypothetical protein
MHCLRGLAVAFWKSSGGANVVIFERRHGNPGRAVAAMIFLESAIGSVESALRKLAGNAHELF